ncbi:MAG: ParA family protein [Betaproteobacteria bacterium]
MKTIVVANQKGGVGKTTIARHLVFYGVERGLRVLAVDMDVQGNLTTTFRTLAGAGDGSAPPALSASGLFDPADKLLPAPCGERLHYVAADAGIVNVERGDLARAIKAGQRRFATLGKSFDVCVIDTGPAVSNLLVVALAVGDFAVSPCKPDRDAIAGLANFFGNVLRVRDDTRINPRLAPLGVLPNLVSPRRAYHRNVLAEMRAAWGEGVLPVQLYERASIDVAKDRAVWRTDRGEGRSQAAREMKTVCNYIYTRMGF